MMSYFQFLILGLSAIFVSISAKSFTEQRNPIITSVEPAYGGVEGGTEITIYGVNFHTDSLFSKAQVFFGNDLALPCSIIDHHSGDSRLVCITPACSSDVCNNGELWSGSSIVELSVFVSTIEGILSASSTFTYLNAKTPRVHNMQSTIYGSASARIHAQTRLHYLNELSVFIGDGNRGDLGSDGDLNHDEYSVNNNARTFYYYPPQDLAGGFYNFSLFAQDTPGDGYDISSGKATMFEEDRYPSDDYHYQYMFQSSLRGIVHSVCLLPSIAEVEPKQGSLGGNVVVTITGSGFSLDSTELEVLVGGLPCAVHDSDTTWIKCTTAAHLPDTSEYLQIVDDLEHDPSSVTILDSSRKTGSSGWWCKLWNRDDRSNNDIGNEDEVELQFGFRQPFYFSLSNIFGYSWMESLAFDTTNREYTMDSGSVFTAPYTARYTFYISSDDTATLFGSFDGINNNDDWLCASTYHPNSFGFYEESTQISDTIELAEGQEYFLKSRFFSSGGADFVLIAVKISPIYDCDGMLVTDVVDECADSATPEIKAIQETNFPSELIQHHRVKEIQQISLTLPLDKEIQVINITDATSGDFRVIVQGRVATDLLSMSSSSSTIRNALRSAALEISSADRETSSFSVWKRDGGSFMEIYVEFTSDNESPYTMLIPFPVDFVGDDPRMQVVRTQEHSPFPTDSFTLSFEGKSTQIAWDSSTASVKKGIEDAFEVDVDVSRAGSDMSGYSWVVTFMSLYQDAPEMLVDAAGIGGVVALGEVQTFVNASATELFFEPIPAWMVSVPVEWATGGQVKSSVEVFRTMPSGDKVKAVCDATEPGSGDFLGTVKGTELECAHSYSSNATALITDTSITTNIDSNTVEIGIEGFGFMIGGEDASVVVTIGGEKCNVTERTDNGVSCIARSVPWGERRLSLNIDGYGDAIFKTDSNITFTQAVYSVTPLSGSVGGGQVLTIEGRGFRRNALIEMGSGTCDITAYTSSRIECITPSAVPTSNSTNSTNSTEGVAGDSWTSIVIDNMAAPEMYLYDKSVTPLVDSIFPNDVSTATTHAIEITGSGFTSGTTVAIDDLQCIVQELYADFISCLLVRSAPRQKERTDVKVFIPSIGYASEASAMTTLPSVNLGFDVQDVVPLTASRMGGALLSIAGFGFEEDQIGKHNVQLTKVGRIPGVFEELLVGLDLYDGAVPGTLECSIEEVSFELIKCRIPEYEDSQLEGNYSIAVTLNDLTAECVETDRNCFLRLTNTSTPVIFATDVSLVSATTGEVDITLVGSDVFGEGLWVPNNIHIMLGQHMCTVQSLSAATNTAVVRTPSLAAGIYELSVLVKNMGYSEIEHSAKHVTIGADITSVVLSSPAGSAGGGSKVVISGYGFNTHCAENVLSLSVVEDSSFFANVTDIMNCTTTEMTIRLPSVIALLSGPSFSTLQSRELTLLVPDQESVVVAVDFSYDKDISPAVVSSTTSAAEGGVVTMLIDVADHPSFDGDSSVSVFIGDMKCPLLSKSAVLNAPNGYSVTLTCTMPMLPGDMEYSIIAVMGALGAAVEHASDAIVTLPVISSEFSVDVMDPSAVVSSMNGNNHLTVSGTGLSAYTHVNVCGESCEMIASELSSTSLSCRLPARQTVTSVDYFKSIGLEIDNIIDLDGALFSSGSASLDELEDGDYATSFSHNSLNCFIGVEIPDGFTATPYRLRFFPTLQTAADFGDMVYEGSTDGGSSYVEIANTSRVQEGWNFLTASAEFEDTWFTHFRFRDADSSVKSQCNLAEIRFLGTLAATSDSCDVTVMSMTEGSGFTPFVIGSVAYTAEDVTPMISAITPDSGSALGGTEVTLTGLNFLSPTEPEKAPQIYLKGVMCNVTSFSDTEIQCITGERDMNAVDDDDEEEDHEDHDSRRLSTDNFVADADVEVQVFVTGVGEGVAGVGVSFMYIDKWSALTTWRNQEPPIDGDMVWIPKGQVIMLDINSPLLLVLLVEGELYFDTTTDITLDAHYILINGGHFEVGTDEDPYLHQAVITLHGSRRSSIELPHIGSKVLAVGSLGMAHNHGGDHHMKADKGVLKIFGQPRLRTWTKIKETAPAGQDFIVTSEPVDFQPGDVLVITGSEIGSKPLEVVTVSMDGDDTVYFTPPLPDLHRSEIRVIEGRSVDLRCEVALLTRNIVIRGDENSNGELFGVHTIAIGSDVVYQIQNVEITKCGQAFNVGRYCTHTHHGGYFEGNFIKANSIHHSFQRAVTTHDALHWEVRDNVAYDVKGHTYFVEDGNEFYNTFSGNLGILTRFSSSLLKSDHKPAVFWTSNPNNFWRDNVAAHSNMFGFWFELVGSAPSGTINNVCAQGEHLGAFHNNTVKVNAALGFRIYPNWTPHEDPCDTSSPPAPQYLRELTSYRNGGSGMFAKHHGDLHHIDVTLVENRGVDIDIFRYEHVEYTTDPTIVNAIIVGSLEPDDDLDKGRVAVWAPQSEFFYMKDITFVNFGKTALLTGCNKCESGEFMNNDGFTTRFEGLTFVRSSTRTKWSPFYKQIFWDLDGSLAGSADSYVLKWYDFNSWSSDCFRLDTDVYDDSMLCTTPVRRLEIDFAEPNVLDFTDLRVYAGDTNLSAEVNFQPKVKYGWVAPVVIDQFYRLEWTDSESSATEFHARLGCEEYLEEAVTELGRNESIGVRFTPFTYDYDPYSYNIYYDGSWRGTSNLSAVELTDPMASASLFPNNTLDVILSTHKADLTLSEPFAVKIKTQLCPPLGCPIPPLPQIPQNSSLWSDPASWPSGSVPVVGEEVVIEGDMWIEMDVSPPKLQSLEVNGKLSFLSDPSADLVLEVNSILVYGFMEIVGPYGGAYEGKAEIILHGTKQTSLPLIIGEGIFAGSKVMAVLGELTMRGQPVVENWVRLANTATAGDTTAELQFQDSGEAWVVGVEVAFSPTAYFGDTGGLWSESAVETRTVTNVAVLGGNIVVISFDTPLTQTHICDDMEGIDFSGAVGLLTRNIKVSSRDSEDSSTSSYGFGGHILVTDRMTDYHSTDRLFSGLLNIEGVSFQNFGKANSDHYAIKFDYSHTHGVNMIQNSSFIGNYNFVLHATKTAGLILRNNVAVDSTGGGIFVDYTCLDVIIERNIIMGVHQLTSILASSYPWTRPVAGITVFSDTAASISGNLVAGSVDQGFSIIAGLFVSTLDWCVVTRGEDFEYDTALITAGVFVNNEAVAGKFGLAIVTAAGEDSASDCAIVHKFTAWRNGHVGIGAVAAKVNILLVEVVVAENHIGVLLDYVKTSSEAVSGVLASTIIGTLNSDGYSDSEGASWDQSCQVFTGADPHGFSSQCSSVIASYYHRAGILVSQWTSRGKTCGVDQTWDQCQPYDTPERLCAMPYDKRYAVPVGMQYSEMHIHDSYFVGFKTDVPSGQEALSSTAVAINPSQIDQQPTMIISGLTWKAEVNDAARFNFPGSDRTCESRTCMGLDMNIIHDLDGTLVGNNVPSQILQGNPGYAAPSPDCQTASHLGTGVTTCAMDGFRQYSALWKDNQHFLIGPIVVSREFSDENRSYASYAPLDDLCAMRFSFSRFPMYIAPGTFHRIETTGTVPQTWYFRWDAPFETDSAVLEFFIHGSNAVRVFTGESEKGTYTEVTRFEDRLPTLSDPAGSSARNPQARTLTVTVRGGTRRFYKFVVVPVVAINMKMEMDFDTFFLDNFIVNIAALFGISSSRIKVVDVRRGSVIITFTVDPTVLDIGSADATQETLQEQVDELANLATGISSSVEDGSLAAFLNTSIDSFTILETVVSQDDDLGDLVGDQNVTNATDVTFIVTPLITVAPSNQPTGVPSSIVMAPTAMPSFQCTLGSRDDCNNRGICETNSEGQDRCVCDRDNHYWSSERCSTYHDGGELADGQCCIPDEDDYYCSWQGTCDPTGKFCICDNAEHRFPEDRCSTWFQSPPLNPGEVCSPDTVDDYCHWKGRCNSAGTGCDCFDPEHYLSSDQCAKWRTSTVRRLATEASPMLVVARETETLAAYPIDVDPSDTIAMVKEKIETKNGHSIIQQRIVFDGIELNNERSLSSYNIETLSLFHVIVMADDECPGFPSSPSSSPTFPRTESPTGPSVSPTPVPTRNPTRVPTAAPTRNPTRVPTVAPSIASVTPAPSAANTACMPGDRAYCNNRGVCTHSNGVSSCACYDFYHYWSSEQCSVRHNGRELADGQICYPNVKDQYCSWLGTCNADGSACVCDDPDHRIPEEKCKVWHSAVPSPAPVLSPTIADAPTPPPQAAPTKAPTLVVCTSGDRGFCNNRGRCSSSGTECVCDDIYHYWSSEKCSTYHWGRDLEDGHVCYPGTSDYYCNYLGVCAADGLACECFDSIHRSPADACKTWNAVTNVPTPAPAPLTGGQVCVPDDMEYCNNNGFCVSTGDGCECWNEANYWPSDQCSTYHHGAQLEDPSDCCLPGFVDFYCSWLGECASDGESCVCHDPDHYWASDRCQQYHDGPDPVTQVDNSCPALLSIPSENSEEGSGGSNSTNDPWQYLLYILLGAFSVMALLSFAGYKYYNDHYSESRRSSSYSSTPPLTKTEVEVEYNSMASHPYNDAKSMQLSILNDFDDESGEVDLSGIYKQNASLNEYSTLDSSAPGNQADEGFDSFSGSADSTRRPSITRPPQPHSPKRGPIHSRSFMASSSAPKPTIRVDEGEFEDNREQSSSSAMTAVTLKDDDDFQVNANEFQL